MTLPYHTTHFDYLLNLLLILISTQSYGLHSSSLQLASSAESFSKIRIDSGLVIYVVSLFSTNECGNGGSVVISGEHSIREISEFFIPEHEKNSLKGRHALQKKKMTARAKFIAQRIRIAWHRVSSNRGCRRSHESRMVPEAKCTNQQHLLCMKS